jgi:pimeloyl-ACP methyl ester carboxylesterase
MRLLDRAVAAGLLGPALAGSLPGQVPGRPGMLPSTQPSSAAFCSADQRQWWARLGAGGQISCARDPSRPAILLVHGLHQSLLTWTAPSTVGYSYDLARDPGQQRIGDTHAGPNAGVYKLGVSEWLYGADAAAWDRGHNWFDYLAGLGFTVAAWSQPGLGFEEAVPSALAAFDSLLVQTRSRNPAAPPPVALIGHSRGGLLIRRILKDRKASGDMPRVKWVATIHSPHQGSELGQWPGRLASETADLMDCCAPAVIVGPLKTQLRDLVTEAMRPMTKLLVDFESRELTPGGPLLRALASGETPLPGIKYYTFGGVNPSYFRLYVWTFDAMSAVPQYKGLSQYFVWRASPVLLVPLSPVFDKIRPFVPEVTVGLGDGLVTDVSARLPWSTHFTDRLNHAEVLWDRGLQSRVAQLIDPMQGRGAMPGPRP